MLRTTILAIAIAGSASAAVAQTPTRSPEHSACLVELQRIVAETQLTTMAKAAGGWNKLSGKQQLDLMFKALADAEQLAQELDVHSSLDLCRKTLAPIKLFVQGARP